MKKIDEFTGLYSLSKTLRFKLVPIGKTLENFKEQDILAHDEHRAESYAKVKKLIDRYHRDYIEGRLSGFVLDSLSDYAEIYFSSANTPEEKEKRNEQLSKQAELLRKQIAKQLTKSDDYKKLFKKEMITEFLPKFLTEQNELDLVAEFNNFSTYFTGFYENRENMYTEEEQSTGIAYRCINDNLPKFLDNIKTFQKIRPYLQAELDTLNTTFKGIYETKIEDMFTVDYFSFALSQSGITQYNNILGGYTPEQGMKIQGLNEYINLYNQQHKDAKLPQLKPLFKQILSERSSLSFIPEKFDKDQSVLNAIENYFHPVQDDNPINESELRIAFKEICKELNNLFAELSDEHLQGIYVKNGTDLTTFSKDMYHYYGAVASAWNDDYDCTRKTKKDFGTEKYLDTREKAYKSIKSFSLSQIDAYGAKYSAANNLEYISVLDFIRATELEKTNAVLVAYQKAEKLLTVPYDTAKNLISDDDAILLIKNLLDAVKDLEGFLQTFTGTGIETQKDEFFYGIFSSLYNTVCEIDLLYDKVRNYMTQKPYSKDKIKLNFENPQLAGGWDTNKEFEYNSMLFYKDGKYYLGLLNSESKLKSKDFEAMIDCCNSNYPFYKKIIYKQIPNAAKYFSSKQINPKHPPENIKTYLSKDFDKKAMTKEQLTELIRYVADEFIPGYEKLYDRNGKSYFNFHFKPYEEYTSWKEFCDDIDKQAYTISFCNISENDINTLVENGQMFLFQIYSKDFSEKKFGSGTPNLHTMYFTALFEQINLENVVYKLNGGAELFYRKASIKVPNTVHKANEPLKNKNELNHKKTSCFSYDLIKDKRFTQDQFMLHFPITLNLGKPKGINLNQYVRMALKQSGKNYVIGIDRGERNLLYICVIDEAGTIVEQYSLNQIINEYQKQSYTTDYYTLLSKKEADRKDARKNWTAVENIKDLKAGYISHVVNKICQLVEKYDAIIAMEDLNFGFKTGRSKVEKAVYQKFEKALIDKLNYYVNKKTDPNQPGGLYHAYQLTNKFESFKKIGKQNGFIFYIPAWLTSKIDPATGFVNLLNTRFTTIKNAQDFIECIDRIAYNEKDGYYEFDIDYPKFGVHVDSVNQWTLCSYGSRINTFRNSKTQQWESEEIPNLTEEFTKFFRAYQIDIHTDLKKQILSQTEKAFYKKFMFFFKLMLQMRNSMSNSDIDYMISPVKNAEGKFYCSNDYKPLGKTAPLPIDADANGAYNIARKALWAIDRFKATDDEKLAGAKLSMSKAEWLAYAQKHNK